MYGYINLIIGQFIIIFTKFIIYTIIIPVALKIK